MPGPKPYDAVARFLSTLDRALSCVQHTNVTVRDAGYRDVGPVHGLLVDPLDLTRPGGSAMRLELVLNYRIVRQPSDVARDERFKVSTTRYQHKLSDNSGEILSWHWHPEPGLSPSPHLHVSRADGSGPVGRRHHVPAGRVTVESILRFLLGDLGVRANRPNWSDVLDGCEGDFRKFATWGARLPRVGE